MPRTRSSLSRTNHGSIKRGDTGTLPESKTGLKTADLASPRHPGKPLMPRKTIETYPPLFLEDFPSGTDNGRVQLIKAHSGLGRVGVCLLYPAIPERFPGEKSR